VRLKLFKIIGLSNDNPRHGRGTHLFRKKSKDNVKLTTLICVDKLYSSLQNSVINNWINWLMANAIWGSFQMDKCHQTSHNATLIAWRTPCRLRPKSNVIGEQVGVFGRGGGSSGGDT
jgi:hypothetical protein